MFQKRINFCEYKAYPKTRNISVNIYENKLSYCKSLNDNFIPDNPATILVEIYQKFGKMALLH